jgi:glycosyltransferase involved in cell wall biosynthesis
VKPRVLLVRPTGSKGGGMMRVADYLLAHADGTGVDFATLDARGDGPVLFTPLVFARESARMHRMIRQGRIQLVHVFVGDRLSLLRKCAVARIALTAGAPVVLHLHAYALGEFLECLPGFVGDFVARVFRDSASIVVLGPAAAQEVATRFCVEPARIRIVANGVDAPSIRPTADARSTRRFLFCGNASERKGVGLLLGAFAAPAVQATGATLVLVGGGDLPRYKELARSLGIGDRVEFAGWQDRPTVSRLMSSCRALVLPSYYEALPLAVLEALGHGLPCIATPVGELSAYTDRVAAIRYVAPGDLEGLAAAVQAIATDDALASRYSDEGRKLFERFFSVSSFNASVHEVYRSVLSGRESARSDPVEPVAGAVHFAQTGRRRR